MIEMSQKFHHNQEILLKNYVYIKSYLRNEFILLSFNSHLFFTRIKK